jgi:hypothetical protein
MRRLLSPSVLAVILTLSALGCESGGGFPGPSSMSGSGYSGSSSAPSSYSGGSQMNVPNRAAGRADLVVRPDALVIVFALKETQADGQQALAGLKEVAADMERRLKETTAGAASMKMCGVSIQAEPGKKVDDGEAGEVTVLVDGSIEVKLAPELDFWARSRLLASVAKVTRELSGQLRSSKPERMARFNEPSVVVLDPEVHRAKLTEAWIKRSREFAAAAQASPAPLYLLDCAPPARIEQLPISLEEVGLTLPMTCRIDALRTPKVGAAP